ncbi:MAG TPA: hypothetical protein VKX96_15000 [Chloroflexota bacterium]|nr:hypothetical protein [Chloroflexota bacterium]
MITRSIFAVLAALSLLFGLSLSAFAATGPLEGTPTIADNAPTGYYIWHNDDGYHLRTHGPGAEHDFTARVHTNGIFEDVSPFRLESGDTFDVVDGGHTLLLHFHTYDGTDGVNFRIRGGEYVRFRLDLDGQLISTNNIFLGPTGSHPATNPFQLDR